MVIQRFYHHPHYRMAISKRFSIVTFTYSLYFHCIPINDIWLKVGIGFDNAYDLLDISLWCHLLPVKAIVSPYHLNINTYQGGH